MLIKGLKSNELYSLSQSPKMELFCPVRESFVIYTFVLSKKVQMCQLDIVLAGDCLDLLQIHLAAMTQYSTYESWLPPVSPGNRISTGAVLGRPCIEFYRPISVSSAKGKVLHSNKSMSSIPIPIFVLVCSNWHLRCASYILP